MMFPRWGQRYPGHVYQRWPHNPPPHHFATLSVPDGLRVLVAIKVRLLPDDNYRPNVTIGVGLDYSVIQSATCICHTTNTLEIFTIDIHGIYNEKQHIHNIQ